MNGTDILNIALTLIDEAPVNNTFDVSNTAEYRAKAPYMLNAIQVELLDKSDYFKSHTISRKPITPLLGEYAVLEHNTSDLNYDCAGMVSSYYFEVNGSCTVYIEDYTTDWNILATINPIGDTKFTAYSGKVTGTVGATRSRIRFSGSYYYNFTNFALYKENFEGSVPAYRPYVKQTLPVDYDSLNEIIVDSGDYERGYDYKFEGKDFYIPYDFEGNMRIIYRPIPTLITTLDQILDLDATICRGIVPYGLGAKLMVNENTKVASYLQSVYDELKQTLKKTRPSERQKIIDTYDATCNF